VFVLWVWLYFLYFVDGDLVECSDMLCLVFEVFVVLGSCVVVFWWGDVYFDYEVVGYVVVDVVCCKCVELFEYFVWVWYWVVLGDVWFLWVCVVCVLLDVEVYDCKICVLREYCF